MNPFRRKTAVVLAVKLVAVVLICASTVLVFFALGIRV